MPTPDDERPQNHFPAFIGTSPLGKDLFEGQAHDAIATSIANLIRSNQTTNKLLGLDGAWGSGKSNLTQILESKLSDTHHFFYYDAWGHQEDLQRRSFLEELTANLCGNDLIDPNIWKNKLKDLLSRQQETKTKTIPRVSHGIIWTAFVLVLTPIAQTISESQTNLWLKSLLTSIPLIVGLFAYVIASINAGRLLSLSDVYAIYKDHELSQETRLTISEKEPSVSEFQAWMRDLSAALKKKQLVVVFDNMDRLPRTKVRELWSSIHTFFAESSFDRIWVIVPFDRNHIIRIFEASEKINAEFLRKSFSIIYRVAPPVLTDWQHFFDLKFQEAFGQAENAELQTVRRIFDRLCKEITPRKVISFINDLVAYRQVTDEGIKLRYIAVFVLEKETILPSAVDQILSGEYLEEVASIFANDPDVADGVAALVYNVPLSIASQVTLSREIEIALRDGNGDRLNFLAQHGHFLEILRDVVGGDGLDIDNAVFAIAELENERFHPRKDSRITSMWDDLCSHVMRTLLGAQEFSTTHELLLTHCSHSTCEKLANYLVAKIQEPKDEFSGSKYFEALSKLRQVVDETGLDIDVFSMMTEVEVSPSTMIDYLSAARNNFDQYGLRCDEAELQEYVITCTPDELTGSSSLVFAKEKYDFAPVIEHFESVAESDSLNVNNVGPFYELYRELANEKPIQVMEPNHLSNTLSQMNDDSDGVFDLLSMRLACGANFPSMGGIDQSILTNTESDVIDSIAERIEYYEDYGTLLLNHLDWPQQIMKEILTILTEDSYGTSRLSITNVLQRYADLKRSLDIQPVTFLKRLNRWSKYAQEQITPDTIAEQITDHELFRDAVLIDCDLTNHLIQTQIGLLNSQDLEEWRDVFEDEESFFFKVVYYLLESGKMKRLPNNAVTVYKQLLVSTAKGEFEIHDEDAWATIYRRTHKSKLKASAKDIRDLFISTVDITPQNFVEFSDILIDHGSLEERSGDVARRMLTPVVDNGQCLNIVLNNADKFVAIINAAGDDASNLKDSLEQMVADPNVPQEWRDFAEAIGIEMDN